MGEGCRRNNQREDLLRQARTRPKSAGEEWAVALSVRVVYGGKCVSAAGAICAQPTVSVMDEEVVYACAEKAVVLCNVPVSKKG